MVLIIKEKVYVNVKEEEEKEEGAEKLLLEKNSWLWPQQLRVEIQSIIPLKA